MVKDHRIKGHRLLARCCYGSCLGFGFVITTITFAAMFWMIWCYLGLSFVQFSDSQRRSLVNYPPVTAKPPAAYTPTSSPNISEISLNQIPNSSTATSDVLRSDHSSITDKQKDLVHERSPLTPKRAFVNNDRNSNKTRGRDIIINDGSRDMHKSSSKPDMPETSTKYDDIITGKDDRSVSKSLPEEEIITATELKNWRAADEDTYIDPAFIRENSRLPNREDLPRDNRRDNAPQPKDGQQVSRDNTYRDRIPVDRRKSDTDTDKRISDDNYRDSDRRRDRVNKYDDINPTEIRNRDRVQEDQFYNERKLINRQEDEYRDRDRDDRYSERRGRDDRDRYDDRYRDRIPVDDRFQPRGPVDDKYDDRYRSRIPADDKYSDDRYRPRVPVDDKYDDRYRDRVPVEDRYDERRRVEDRYEDRYRDRRPADDRYIERYPDERRRGGDGLDYDDKRVREYRYRDRDAQDDRYSESGRRRTSDDKYDPPEADERYRDEVRKKDDDSKYDTREDAYRYRDRIDEERGGSERKRDDNLPRSRPRDAYADRYDSQEARRNRENIPSSRDTPDYAYSSRTDDKRYENLPPSSEKDLLSSRAEYEPRLDRLSPERREYSTRNERRTLIDDVPDRGPSRSYSSDYNTEMKKEGGSESRYNNGYRNQEYQGRSQYDDRSRIAPTRVADDQNFQRDTVGGEDDVRKKSLNDDRRRYTSLGNSRSSATVRNTNFESSDDRAKMSTRIDGSKETGDTRRRYDLKPSDEKRVSTDDGAIDRRSYTSEDGFNGNRKSQSPVDLRDSGYRPIDTETRDYRYEDSPSRYDDRVDEYRPSRRTVYESTDYSDRGSNSRNRDRRYDGERGTNIRNRDIDDDRYSRDRDVYRDTRRDSEETPRRNREKAYEERHDEKYERYPSSDDEVRRRDTLRPIRKDFVRSDNSESRDRRYQPENDRGASPSRGISVNQKDDRPLMESRRDRDPLPLNSGSESKPKSAVTSNNKDQLTPRAELIDGVSLSMSSSYDPEQPLSAKDVIDTALRHAEIPGQVAKKVFYPVFDPRSSNLTSPDIIRPSERRGITVTAKKRRKR